MSRKAGRRAIPMAAHGGYGGGGGLGGGLGGGGEGGGGLGGGGEGGGGLGGGGEGGGGLFGTRNSSLRHDNQHFHLRTNSKMKKSSRPAGTLHLGGGGLGGGLFGGGCGGGGDGGGGLSQKGEWTREAVRKCHKKSTQTHGCTILGMFYLSTWEAAGLGEEGLEEGGCEFSNKVC